jgi:hypothetical protein
VGWRRRRRRGGGGEGEEEEEEENEVRSKWNRALMFENVGR